MVVALIAGAVYLRKLAAPEVARLLPGSEGVVYVNLSGFRLASSLANSPVTISREPEYEDFVRETGFQFERDLEEVAIAVSQTQDQRAVVGDLTCGWECGRWVEDAQGDAVPLNLLPAPHASHVDAAAPCHFLQAQHEHVEAAGV